ncbi:radical SAM protein, partial [Oceanidesulfovibrio indonesiensis]
MKYYLCHIHTHDADNSLTRGEVEKIVSDAAHSGTKLIMFLGGEPLINPWLIDVVEKFPTVAFLGYSNGMLLTDEKIERIARMGHGSIALSVDSLKENTDKRRGEGTFDKITAIMRKLNKAGVVVGISAMLCRHNCEDIFSDEFMDSMIENAALYGWIPMVVS